MFRFDIEIDGNSRYKVIRKLTSLNNKIKVPIKTGLTGMAQDVENLANENLRTSLDPGSQSLPRPEQSIFNNWKTDEPVKYEQGDYVKYLYNNSDHALAVEHGTMDGDGYIYPVYSPYLKIQFADGRVEKYPYVRGQPPKLYTTTAMATYADKSIDVFKGMFSEALSMISVSK